MKNLPGRFAGVVLLGVAVLLYDAACGWKFCAAYFIATRVPT